MAFFNYTSMQCGGTYPSAKQSTGTAPVNSSLRANPINSTITTQMKETLTGDPAELVKAVFALAFESIRLGTAKTEQISELKAGVLA
jgi:hypothetical protein